MEVVLAAQSLPPFAWGGRGLPAVLEQIDRAIGIALENGDLGAAAKLEAQRWILSGDESFFTKALAHADESGDLMARAFVAGHRAAGLGALGQYERAFPFVEKQIELLADSPRSLGARVDHGRYGALLLRSRAG